MNAVISGSAGTALLLQGDAMWALRAGDTSKHASEEHDVRYLFADARDLVFFEDIDEAAVRTELELAHCAAVALHLGLMLCDPRTCEEAWILAVEEFGAATIPAGVLDRVERVLCAKPMLAPLMPALAVERCLSRNSEARHFFAALELRQHSIQQVRRAWDGLPSSLFEADERSFVDGRLATEGLFLELVNAVQNQGSLTSWLETTLRSPLVESLRLGKRWIAEWAALLVATEPGLVGSRPAALRRHQISPRVNNCLRDAKARYEHGEFEEAVRIYQQAILVAREIGDFYGEEIAVGDLGNAYQSLSRSHAALEQFEKALRLAESLGDAEGEARALNNMGRVHIRSNPTGALAYLIKARDIFQSLGDATYEAYATHNLGTVYLRLSEPALALAHYTRAADISRQANDRRNEAFNLAHMGLAAVRLKRVKEAVSYLDHAMKLADSVNDLRTKSFAGDVFQVVLNRHRAPKP